MRSGASTERCRFLAGHLPLWAQFSLEAADALLKCGYADLRLEQYLPHDPIKNWDHISHMIDIEDGVQQFPLPTVVIT